MPEPDLRTRIKEMLVKNLMLQTTADQIADDLPLFGPGGLGLDSIDALELVVSMEKTFGVGRAEFRSRRAGAPDGELDSRLHHREDRAPGGLTRRFALRSELRAAASGGQQKGSIWRGGLRCERRSVPPFAERSVYIRPFPTG